MSCANNWPFQKIPGLIYLFVRANISRMDASFLKGAPSMASDSEAEVLICRLTLNVYVLVCAVWFVHVLLVLPHACRNLCSSRTFCTYIS